MLPLTKRQPRARIFRRLMPVVRPERLQRQNINCLAFEMRRQLGRAPIWRRRAGAPSIHVN